MLFWIPSGYAVPDIFLNKIHAEVCVSLKSVHFLGNEMLNLWILKC